MRLIPWTFAALLLAGGLTLAPQVPLLEAQSLECEAVTVDGEPRNCTVTEEMGMCLTEALDSRAACVEDFPGWVGARLCDALFIWDGAACVLEAIVDPVL